jgi:hypothetical protein
VAGELRVDRAAHPRGNAGAHKSMATVARKAAQGRMAPEVGKWAIDAVVAAGNPRDAAGRARVIFEALVRTKAYLPDPVDGERIVDPVCMLGETCGPLAFGGGDCDDLTAALIAALESVGIHAAVVGQAFDDAASIQHVLAAVWTGRGWVYADPSEHEGGTLPFGEALPSTWERWVTVPDSTIVCDARSCDISKMAPPPPPTSADGDYVGVTRAEPASVAPPANDTGMRDGILSSLIAQVLFSGAVLGVGFWLGRRKSHV